MFGHQDDEPVQDNNAVSDEPAQAQDPATTETAVNPDEPTTEQPAGDSPADTGAPDGTNDSGDGNADTDGNAPAEGSEEVVIKPDAEEQPADQPQDQPQDQPKDESQDEAAKPEEPAGDDWQHPDTPLDQSPEPEPISDVISPAGGFPKRPTFQYPTALNNSDAPGNQADNPQDEELLNVKKQALSDLAPIIDKLDLPPEEKFRAIMMIIQADDDESLVKAAYEAAHSIEDEKARAEALLDIVNEVNYFTQPPADDQTEPQE